MKKIWDGRLRIFTWLAVIAACFVFAFAGAPLAALRGWLEYRYRIPGNKALRNTAIAVMCTAVCMLLMGFGIIKADTEGFWLMTAMWLVELATGAALFTLHLYLMRQERCFDRMNSIVSVSRITDTRRMARILDMSLAKTERLLRRMIRLKAFTRETRLDEAAHRLRLPGCAWADREVTCDKCGATFVTNIGESPVCPYCGAPLPAWTRQYLPR